jgi:hypothetical protein
VHLNADKQNITNNKISPTTHSLFQMTSYYEVFAKMNMKLVHSEKVFDTE